MKKAVPSEACKGCRKIYQIVYTIQNAKRDLCMTKI